MVRDGDVIREAYPRRVKCFLTSSFHYLPNASSIYSNDMRDERQRVGDTNGKRQHRASRMEDGGGIEGGGGYVGMMRI